MNTELSLLFTHLYLNIIKSLSYNVLLKYEIYQNTDEQVVNSFTACSSVFWHISYWKSVKVIRHSPYSTNKIFMKQALNLIYIFDTASVL